MNKRTLLLLVAILTVTALPVQAAQTSERAYFTADKTSYLIGEPIQLVLHLRVPQDAQLALPDFSKSLSPLVVEKAGSLNLSQHFDDSTVEYQVSLQGVFWRIGTYQAPPLPLSYQSAGATTTLTVESFQIEVVSVLTDNDLVLRPLKPLIYLPYLPLWLIIPFIAVMVIAVVIVRRRLVHLRRPTAVEDTSITGHPDAVSALKTLRQIEQSNESPLVIYTQVADCLRRYLTNRYALKALDLTTAELIDQLNAKTLFANEDQHKLAEMLKRADLVKFARVVPKQGAAQQYTTTASQWIQSVEHAKVEQPS